MPNHMSKHMSERTSKHMSTHMSKHMSQQKAKRMPEHMPKHMSKAVKHTCRTSGNFKRNVFSTWKACALEILGAGLGRATRRAKRNNSFFWALTQQTRNGSTEMLKGFPSPKRLV